MRNSVCKRLRRVALEDTGGTMSAVYDGEGKTPVFSKIIDPDTKVVSFVKTAKGLPVYMTKCARSVYKSLKRLHHEGF